MEDPNPNPPRHAQEFPATLPLKPVHMRNLETKTKLGTPPVRPGGPEVSKMCPDREMLAHRFHADLRVYAAAANSLVQAVGSNFSEALRHANRAHLVFEHARDQLNKHIRDHGCSKSTPIARTEGAG